ncbi:CoA transferase [Pseudomonas oryzihabitans]|uniref:CoA transferase n=1 Tax=Pseudomonas oryzihabitans TaxID=47885 RepID=UPI00289436E9|nr:CoA transferase [Pseudomonas oryzihabitans]MDT3720396.1 CoA transferase [Pseudomonas oryzihabitans]
MAISPASFPALPALLDAVLVALELPGARSEQLRVPSADSLASCFPVSDLATASMGVAGLAVADLLGASGAAAEVRVDRHLAAAWFKRSLKPEGWALPDAWDPVAGDYRTRDGWIRLHTNAAHHRTAALGVLDCPATRSAVAEAVATWSATALETAVVASGGCAAELHSLAAWQAHEQGRAVRAEPLVALRWQACPIPTTWRPTPLRPLAGIRVLDLTRILAGPIATRLLAGLGAEVLRLDPPGWEEPALAPEVTLGKRCARLDLRRPADRLVFEGLLAEADVLVHGYRADALERLGYGNVERRALNPALIDVSLCAYGWTGPWALRRGYDSLVQMSCGIAAAGSDWQHTEQPVPLPVQALDHATGYLMAAAVIRGLAGRLRERRILSARLSLARTACLLTEYPAVACEPLYTGVQDTDYDAAAEPTAWGPALRLRPPLQIGELRLQWERPATQLGSARAAWSTGG